MRSPGRRETLLMLVAGFVIAAAFSARGDDPAAQLFSESCSACHTIGQGAGVGPDLLASTQWPKEPLRIAVKRMEDNVGPLTDAQVDGLVELLKAADVKQRLAALEQPAAEQPAPQPLGSEANGRRLFFGEQPLANGGTPCFACHAVRSRGGNLAADLTAVHARLGPVALVSAAAKPPYPTMKAAYAQHPVTPEEALDLAAFLGSFAKGPPAQPLPEPALPLQIGALSFAGVILGAVALLFRSRRAGVRSRLVRDSSER